MNPRDRRLRLRKSTAVNLNPATASEARGGIVISGYACSWEDTCYCSWACTSNQTCWTCPAPSVCQNVTCLPPCSDN
jgi:hypothetical protein